MTKPEFLDTLGRTLRRSLSEQEVEDNLRYYENYIDQQIQSGKNESQVFEELGDPRLIAMTILQVDEQRDEADKASYTSGRTVYTEENGTFHQDGFEQDQGRERDSRGHVRVHSFQMKGWLVLILILLIVILVLGTVFAVLWRLLPILLIITLVLWIYRRFFS